MNDFYVKMGITLIVAGIAGYIMLRIQKRREQDADDQFNLTMKSHGLSTEIEERPMMHAEVAMLEAEGQIPSLSLPGIDESEIEVRDETFDFANLGKVKKKTPSKKKKVSKKKSTSKKRK